MFPSATPRTNPRLLLLVLAVGWGLATVPAARAQSPVSMVADVFAKYSVGVRTAAGPNLASLAITPDTARDALNHLADNLLTKTGSPDVVELQRRLLVSFALEVAEAGAFRNAAASARLVEWACPLVRNHLPQSEFDRAWQLAALSVLEGGLDGHVLAAHLEHLGASMADEPRMQLARGIAEEQNTAPAEAMSSAARNGTAQQRAARARADHDRAIELAVAGFREAQADTTLRAEASLRLGHVLLGEGKFDEALASWTSVEDDTRDPALGYLVRLFRGIAFEGLSRPGDAGTAYRSALAVSPGGHAATMRLAALAFRNGYGEEAGHLLDTLIADDDPSRDFWWEYYTADWRFWFPRIARVRILLAGHSGAPAARQP